jgi:glycosyltransferase involved in cell wall biosynthesis
MAAPHKNHAVLVRAFSELRDMCSDPPGLVLTGKRGPAWADVRREIDRLRVADLVRDLGYNPYDDVLAVLAGSQALAFPSLYEGFGLPVLEAQQLSIPVLASAIPSLCEVGGDGALYIAPSEPTAWARAILRATTHHESQQTLISAGRANARRFSWDSCAAQTFDVLRRAIDNDSRLLFNKA